MGAAAVEPMARGITLRAGTTYRPARLEADGHDGCHAFVTGTEGKSHVVKDVFAVCD